MGLKDRFMTSKEKVQLLREQMEKENIDAFVVFSADPHMSEYLPNQWKERQWLTGFTGSAGFAVVTKENAGLWTDGRYFIQAPKELAGSDFELMKMGVEGVEDYISYLKNRLKEGAVVGANPLATSHHNWEEMRSGLAPAGITLVASDLLKDVWTSRAQNESKPIFVHPVERAGKSVQEKLEDIRKEMRRKEASMHIIASLDDVAWTLNLRGSDVEANPVFLGFVVLGLSNAWVFLEKEQLSTDAIVQMEAAGVQIESYSAFYPMLEKLEGEKVLVSSSTNQAVFEALSGNSIIVSPVPGNLMKAMKNPAELEGFRTVMVKDGVAMVKFLYWITTNVGKVPMTEFSIGQQLERFRAEQEGFVGPSFGSIVGYEGNDAIPHYSAPQEGSKEVRAEGSILVDSGGQYLEGTTDITRTFPLGEVSAQYKRDTTLVLKGMIRLSMVKFPKGTKGVHLDAFAREALWAEGKDYHHGTGHGVGSFMNVHEGPQNIRKDMNPQDLLEGMVVSNEPGLYIENQYGIRHENLIAVRKAESTAFGDFMEFETLTICPFFSSVIEKDLLSPKEIDWLNNYHQWVREKLEDRLQGEEKEWLLKMTEPI